MKKFTLFLLGLLSFAACTDDYNVQNETNYLPETEIFVQGQQLYAGTMSKAAYGWPKVNLNEGWEVARFTIRADGQVQDYTDKSPANYYGRSGNTGNNQGKLSTLYPYGRYNDRDMDYYKKDRKTGENIGWFRYVYDPMGLKTQLAILEAPTVAEILTDIRNDIKNGKVADKNGAKLTQIDNWLRQDTLEPGYLDSHVLWYVAKEVGMQHGWHVNGVIADTVVQDYRINPDVNIPDNVEIDIHQQEHYDWNEIKTSIHIRTDCQSIAINLPLDYETIIEQDDFDIRIFDYYYTEDTIITHKITHNEDGITIEIENIPATMISKLKRLYGDGITVEIHSYCTVSDYWEKLKNSCVISTGKPCTVIGQITSAFNDEVVPVKVMHP